MSGLWLPFLFAMPVTVWVKKLCCAVIILEGKSTRPSELVYYYIIVDSIVSFYSYYVFKLLNYLNLTESTFTAMSDNVCNNGYDDLEDFNIGEEYHVRMLLFI